MKARYWHVLLTVGVLFSALSAPGAPGREDASVVVEHLSQQMLKEGEDASSWRSIPSFLRGADIHSVGDNHKGVSHFEVTRSGTLYMAAHYGYEGNRGGGWTEDRITFDDLVGQGWFFVANMKHGNGRVFRVLSRKVKEGERYRIRVNKYTPPYLITLNDKAGTLPSSETPWLRFGPVAVADFTPRTLQPGVRAGRGVFQEVPASLLGMTIFSDEYRPHGGELEFHVIEQTPIFLAGFWGYDGNASGDWDEERLTLEDMIKQGWKQVEGMVQQNGRVYQVVTKVLAAGETHRIRFNKYSPPHLILPTSSVQFASLEPSLAGQGQGGSTFAEYPESLPRFSATSQDTLALKPVMWVERSGQDLVVQWHPSIPGSYLQRCADLTNPQWETVEGGQTNPYRLSASEMSQYFRIVVPK